MGWRNSDIVDLACVPFYLFVVLKSMYSRLSFSKVFVDASQMVVQRRHT